MNSFALLETIWQDTRYALRTMRGKPAFAATAVLTLALAIGGNTAMFTVIHAVLLKPLQYSDPDRLVRISGGATPTRFAEMKTAAHSFTELAAFTGTENIALSTGAEPEVLRGIRISAGFLRIPGVTPLLGRSFRPEEDSPGGAPVAMISYELWQRRFAADPQIAGKTANLAATAYTIIGVLPPHFQFPFPDVDVWMTAPSEWPSIPLRSRALSPFLSVSGRLKPGVSLEQADAEMKVIRRQYAMAHPTMLDARPKTPVEVTAMKDHLVDKVRSMLWMLFGAAGFVLLIACANVASLLLARATFRSREFAVRSALGAARIRLVGQLLVESLLLSCAGGVLGALLAAWSLRAIPHITALELPRAGEIQMDWMVLGFAAALSIATGIVFGLVPALGASRPDDLTVTLRASGEAAGKGLPRRILAGVNVRGLLVVGQIALSIVLLIGSALLVESIAQMRHVDVGFNPANLLTMRVSLPPQRYDTGPKRTSFFQELVQRAGSLPGVRGAAAALFLPMMGYAGTPVQDAGKPPLKLNERPIATIMMVTPGYFGTLGIPLRRGREFAEQDTADAPRVAVIDEALARRFWPAYPHGQDPVGQRLLIGGLNLKPAEIVGIAANVHQNIEKSAWPETVYVAFAQNPQPFAMLAVRTTGDPLRFTRAVREQVLALDRDQPVADIRTMDDLVEAQVGERHLLMMLLGSFAGVAVLLALIGIYGVIAYSVAQRTQEMGIRRALGAQASDILWLVVGQGLALALAGIALGLGGAFALTRVMQTLLFRVSATDPATFAGIALFFLVVALAASYIPARRAAGIDPMAALRV
jgi:predicted permease